MKVFNIFNATTGELVTKIISQSDKPIIYRTLLRKELLELAKKSDERIGVVDDRGLACVWCDFFETDEKWEFVKVEYPYTSYTFGGASCIYTPLFNIVQE